MSFRNNLLHLRAAKNMTQEQLAAQLGVSRQSVTKWEAEKSYPEMDKLLKMCDIFDCTLDELVTGDLTDVPVEPQGSTTRAADVFGYDEFMRKFANRISNGVMSILLGVALSLVFFGIQETSGIVGEGGYATAEAIGVVCVLAGIAIGISLIIPAGISHAQFVKEHPYIEDFYTQEQKTRAREAFTWQLVGGIVLILVGIMLVVLFGETSFGPVVVMPCMLALIAVGVRFIVHGSMVLGQTNINEYNKNVGEEMDAADIKASSLTDEQKEQALRVHKKDKQVGAICGAIMLVATIIGLLLLFVPLGQGGGEAMNAFFWLPWPIGGILCGIVAMLMKEFGGEE